jgi:hypothetical protein
MELPIDAILEPIDSDLHNLSYLLICFQDHDGVLIEIYPSCTHSTNGLLMGLPFTLPLVWVSNECGSWDCLLANLTYDDDLLRIEVARPFEGVQENLEALKVNIMGAGSDTERVVRCLHNLLDGENAPSDLYE